MKLVADSKTYSFEGADGYSFRVDAILDPEWGWRASVTMTASYFKTDEAAVQHLRHAVEAFLRQLPKDSPR